MYLTTEGWLDVNKVQLTLTANADRTTARSESFRLNNGRLPINNRLLIDEEAEAARVPV